MYFLGGFFTGLGLKMIYSQYRKDKADKTRKEATSNADYGQ